MPPVRNRGINDCKTSMAKTSEDKTEGETTQNRQSGSRIDSARSSGLDRDEGGKKNILSFQMKSEFVSLNFKF